METIAISQFKATCLSLLGRVRQTGQPLLVTKRGAPIAQILPPPPQEATKQSAFGCMRGRSEQLGDIVEPLSGARASSPLRGEAADSGSGSSSRAG